MPGAPGRASPPGLLALELARTRRPPGARRSRSWSKSAKPSVATMCWNTSTEWTKSTGPSRRTAAGSIRRPTTSGLGVLDAALGQPGPGPIDHGRRGVEPHGAEPERRASGTRFRPTPQPKSSGDAGLEPGSSSCRGGSRARGRRAPRPSPRTGLGLGAERAVAELLARQDRPERVGPGEATPTTRRRSRRRSPTSPPSRLGERQVSHGMASGPSGRYPGTPKTPGEGARRRARGHGSGTGTWRRWSSRPTPSSASRA